MILNDLDALVVKTVKGVAVYTLVSGLVLVFVIPDWKAALLGLLYGSLLACLNFVELKNTVKRAVVMSPGNAQSYASRKYFLRYAVLAVALYAAVKSPNLSILSTLVGLLSVKLVILWEHLITSTGFYRNVFNSKRKEE